MTKPKGLSKLSFRIFFKKTAIENKGLLIVDTTILSEQFDL